jgi:hypothetical protein
MGLSPLSLAIGKVNTPDGSLFSHDFMMSVTWVGETVVRSAELSDCRTYDASFSRPQILRVTCHISYSLTCPRTAYPDLDGIDTTSHLLVLVQSYL